MSSASRDADGGNHPDRLPSNDLGLELYRQRTLLQILTGRMRETANGIDRGNRVDPARVRRGIDVHHRYLLEVHQVDAERLADALSRENGSAAALIGQELAKARNQAVAFEREVESLVTKGVPLGGEDGRRLSRLFQAEAERIDRHQAWEGDHIHARIDDWFPKAAQARLLNQIRKFDSARVDAEIALISWASQLHPSSD